MNDEKGEIYVLDLFSGIGGFALAAEIANAMADSGDHRFSPLAHAEVEPFACAVYHRHFPDSVCFGGVQNVSRDSLLERCGVLPDVVCGGFPCQPHSCAGKRLASADERDLWGECRRILGDVRPRFALFENVGGLLTSESGLFYNRVLSDLAAIRYACQWQVVPASAVGAPHRRDRVWMLCWDELQAEGWKRVRFSDECPRCDCCDDAWCREHDMHLADCSCYGPTQDGIEYQEVGGVMFGRVLADSEQQGLEGHAGDESDRSESRRKREEEGGPACESGICTPWPAIDGNWPSRPGEPQHGWEPPRVVGDAAQQLLNGCGTIAGEAGGAKLANASDRQVEQPLGVLFDGLPSAVGGAGREVHNRVAQLKAAGNAIVPEVAAIFMHAILQVYQTEDLA